uniref:Uncharacterized protein n=1 Tax=Trichogramma kaykai TaxID=54128 RepID=A0ABD2WXY9_9HYME
MEPSKMFSCVVRVKKEPIGSLMENEYDIIDKTLDVKSARFFRCPQDNLIHMLQKSDENHQGNLDEVKIEFECKDMKPDVNLLVVTKIEDCLQNNLQDLKNSNIDQVQNKIKVETLEAVKKESFVDDAKKLNMDFDCGLSKPREENSVTKELTDNYRLETQIFSSLLSNEFIYCVKKVDVRKYTVIKIYRVEMWSGTRKLDFLIRLVHPTTFQHSFSTFKVLFIESFFVNSDKLECFLQVFIVYETNQIILLKIIRK